jgi:hypothetical protein
VLALVQRWAWRIPRWLLLLPTWIGGISLPIYGFSLLVLGCLTLAGVVPEPTDTGDFTANGLTWITLFGGASFGGLGTAMALGRGPSNDTANRSANDPERTDQVAVRRHSHPDLP